jgi:hypothetical protein
MRNQPGVTKDRESKHTHTEAHAHFPATMPAPGRRQSRATPRLGGRRFEELWRGGIGADMVSLLDRTMSRGNPVLGGSIGSLQRSDER